MIANNKVLCLQGVIREISKPFDNGTKVELKLDLGTPMRRHFGELRIPAEDINSYSVGDYLQIVVIPHKA